MMKSLTSLPPSFASAVRPSPWSYSPKQIFIFLKVCWRKVEYFSSKCDCASRFTLFFWPSCCLLCLIRSRRRSVSSCEFAKLLIVVSGIGRFTCTCQASGVGIDLPGQRALEGQETIQNDWGTDRNICLHDEVLSNEKKYLPLFPAWWGYCWGGSTPYGRAHKCICIPQDPEDIGNYWSVVVSFSGLCHLEERQLTASDLSIHICSLGLSITCPRSFTPLSPIVFLF